MNQLADIRRRLDNLIRSGTIAAVDLEKHRCRVKTGGLTTGWLPWFTRRAGSTNEWDPPSVGEQCTVFSPSGEITQGLVLVGLYSDANAPQSASETIHRIDWANGDYVEHDAASGSYKLQLAGHADIKAASLTITCTGAVKITGATIDLN
ncbi:phage baseplate assembly protein V [Pseudomonas aeruginosa]